VYFLAALATATAVTTAGSIGFIGLIVPHLVRLWLLRLGWGNDQRLLLPATVLVGGSLLLLADTLARIRGVLTQHQSDPFPATVLETALVGRHPHLGRWDWESTADRNIARQALAAVGLADFAEREVHTLSGGERQRLAVAQLLTQQPQLFFLDEPLTHLDLAHQVAVMDLLKRTTEHDAALIAILHDPGFAVRYCDHALLLFGDGEWLAGPSQDIITEKNLSRLYGYPLREIQSGNDRWFIPC